MAKKKATKKKATARKASRKEVLWKFVKKYKKNRKNWWKSKLDKGSVILLWHPLLKN